MPAGSMCIIILCMAVLIFRPCFCEKLRMLKSNARVSGVTETHNARSLIECAYLLENSPDSVSFNYKQDDNTCELSGNYVDDSATVSEGWKVYGMYETDCLDIMQNRGNRTDGVYTVMTSKTGQIIDVFCDMSTDGGGWTVFQYRFDESIDFYRNFSEYENGFGNLLTEFWLGLRYIEEIASQDNTDLRIDLEAADETREYETFGHFSLSTGPAYTLNIGSKIDSSPSVSDLNGLEYHNGRNFTTYDHDVDSRDIYNWAVQYHGAWWYHNCYGANLNGKYLTPGTSDLQSMNNKAIMGQNSLKSSKMMMRRK